MYRREIVSRKVLYCIFVFVLIAASAMTIAYATLSVTLNINGSADIVASNWDIYIDDIALTPGSKGDVLPSVTGGNTINFNVELDVSEFYEFTFNVVNEGSIDAMIDSVVKTPELTTEQAKFIKYEISYISGEPINESHSLEAGSTVPMKVKIEYRTDTGYYATTSTTLSLSIALTYTQADENVTAVPGGGIIGANDSLDKIGTIVTIGTEQFYTIGTEGDNVKLLAKYNLYVGGYYNSSIEEWYAYEDATGIQHKDMVGYNDNKNKGVLAFSNTNYWESTTSSYPINVYNENSNLYQYVDNYKSYIEQYGISVETARLITYEELTDENTFNCNTIIETGEDYEIHTCSSEYPWINSTSYWTGSAYNANKIYSAYRDDLKGIMGTDDYDWNEYNGVRPVIIINKLALTSYENTPKEE